MQAVILVGHGSLLAGSGAAMIRLAARAQEAGVAPVVAAGFLNYSQPPFADTLARLAARGIDELIVQPYFLVPGKFVSVDIPRLLAASRTAYPQLRFRLAGPLGEHPALAELVAKRATQALATLPELHTPPALLLIAHGSPNAAANQPIEQIAAQLQASAKYPAVVLSYLGLNEPLAGDAIDQLVEAGHRAVVVVPYFLQLGGHVAEDLPELIAAARMRHPQTEIVLAAHLGYDTLLIPVIAARVNAVRENL